MRLQICQKNLTKPVSSRIFCKLDKYILKIGQIHCSIWTNTFDYLDKHASIIIFSPIQLGWDRLWVLVSLKYVDIKSEYIYIFSSKPSLQRRNRTKIDEVVLIDQLKHINDVYGSTKTCASWAKKWAKLQQVENNVRGNQLLCASWPGVGVLEQRLGVAKNIKIWKFKM